MNNIEAPCVYTDFTDTDFNLELTRIYQETAIEREWTRAIELPSYQSDEGLVWQASAGNLVRVDSGNGYQAISRLSNWDLSRSQPEHEFYYSAPYLRPEAYSMLGKIGLLWQCEVGDISQEFSLSVTSLMRSRDYQTQLAQTYRKATINPAEGWSSHVYGLAKDIDGRGLYHNNGGSLTPVNIHDNPEHRTEISTSQDILRQILESEKTAERINYVEEMPNTRQHVFHICTNSFVVT